MKNYRFTAQEINQMKDFILTSINNETEKRTAWRARLVYEMEAQCSSTKKSRTRGERMLALYEQLTTNDLPNWTTPDQRRTEPTTDGPQTNFDALLGTDISKLKNRLGYWWRLDNGTVNEAGIGIYNFTRPGRGRLHVQTDKNKISYISGWSLDKVV